MTEWLSISITVVIVLFLILLVWARMQQSTIIEVLGEIRDFIRESTTEGVTK